MSMISCPDCGQSISSNAKQCIHCGCLFQVCPECEAVLTGEPKICPECGFQLKKEAAQPTNGTADEKGVSYWYEVAKKSSTFTAILTAPAFRFALRIVAITLAAVALIGAIIWSKPSGFEEAALALIRYEDTVRSRTILYILSALFWFAAAAVSHFETSICVWNFKNVTSVRGLSIPHLIDNEFKLGFERVTQSSLHNRWMAIYTAFFVIVYEKDIFTRLRLRRSEWINCIGSLLFAASFCVFAIINTNAYMEASLMGTEFGFKQLEYIWVPIAGVVLAFLFSAFSGDEISLEGATKWMKENLPQHMEDYTHYILEYNERMDALFDEAIDEGVERSL